MKKKITAIFLVVALALSLGLVPAASVGANPDPGLVGLWHFDEGTGTIAYDSSGNANDGTLMNGASFTAAGYFDYAVSLAGDDDYVSVGDDDDLDISDVITVEAWVNVTSLADEKVCTVVGKWNDMGVDNRAYLLAINTKGTSPDGSLEPKFYISSNGTNFDSVVSSQKLSTGTWYHLAGTFDGDVMKIYVDGIEKGSNDTALTAIATNTQPLLMGGDRAGGTGGNAFFNGIIDEVRIWDEALSADQIGLDLFDVTVEAEGSALAVDIDWSYGEPYVGVTGSDTTPFTLESIIEGTEVTLTAPLTHSSGVNFYVFAVWDIDDTDQTTGDLDIILDVTADVTATAEYTQASLDDLSPPIAFNLVGEEHCVTATISPEVAGVDVSFKVTGANPTTPPAPPDPTETTNEDGEATFCYNGANTGIDTIRAYLDGNGNGSYDAGESTTAPVTKYWFLNFVTGGGHIKYEVTKGNRTIEKPAWNLSGNVGYFEFDSTPHGQFNIIDHVGKMQYHCHDDFSSLIFYGGTAESPEATFDTAEFTGTFYDKDGDPYVLTIIIEDNGEPGKGVDKISVYDEDGSTFWIPDEAGPGNPVVIDGGNYQIHEGYKG